MIRRLEAGARWLARLELGIVILGVAPALIFDSWLPRWAVALALAVIPALWLIRWFGQGRVTRRTPLDLPILILLLMVPVGVWAAAIPAAAQPEVYRILLGAVLFFALVNTLTDGRKLQWATTLLLAATALLSVAALLGTDWGGGKFSLPLLPALYDRLPGLIRPFWNPQGFGSNVIGGGLAMLLPLLIAYAVGGRPWPLRIVWAVAALMGCLALVLTQSRGGIVGLGLAVLVMGLAWSHWFLLVLATTGLAGAGAVSYVGVGRVTHILFSSVGQSAVGSLEGRLELWSRALYMMQDFPFTGIGLGMFDRVLDLLYPLFLTGPDALVPHPHNIFLAQAVDAGIPGLIAFLALLLLLFFMAGQSIRLARGTRFAPLAIGLLGALVAYLGHGLFDSITSFIKAHTILWGLVGLQTALWLYLSERRETAAVEP
jgi:putative inorganic carbon (HCO3(-)) transporter